MFWKKKSKWIKDKLPADSQVVLMHVTKVDGAKTVNEYFTGYIHDYTYELISNMTDLWTGYTTKHLIKWMPIEELIGEQ